MSQSTASMTVQQLVELYIASREKAVSHPESLRYHSRVLLRYFGHLTLEQICQPYVLQGMCQDFNAHCGSADKPATITKRLRLLQASLRWAWKQNWIPGLPVMWTPGNGPPRDRTLSEKERERLFQTADAYPTPGHLRTLIYLSLLTDQYRSTILDLTWDRVKFDEGVIVFYDADRKKRTTHVMCPRLRKALERAQEEKVKGCNYVIQYRGKPVTNPYHGLQAIFDRAGIENIIGSDLRRSVARAPGEA